MAEKCSFRLTGLTAPLLLTVLLFIGSSGFSPVEAVDADPSDVASTRESSGEAADLSDQAITSMADFSLPTHDGKSISLTGDPEARLTVICFLGTECPLARVYGPRLQRMADRFADRGVRFVGVVSTIQDSMEDIQAYVEEHEIRFPVVKDYDQQVAMQAGATRTPEVFIVNQARQVAYQGRIDDQYQPGVARNEAQSHDLMDAIEQLLAGKPISRPALPAVGCLITFRSSQQSQASSGPQKSADSAITYCNQVSRILQKNCIECHRAGQIGPFVLDDYEEVVGWGDMSLEVIDQGRMPPWHADPNVGVFANARHMPDEEKQILRQWVESGMPYGNATDLPESPQYDDGWRMGQDPDLILTMSRQPFAVPAEGTVEYQYFVVDPGFSEDRWVRAAQVIPGNNRVVHHCIVFQRPPDGTYLKGAGLLAGYVPGQISSGLPEGYAYRISAGASLVFQMHYTPNGKPQEDQTKLGLVFADPDDVTHEVYVINGIDTEFEIPPGAANHPVTADVSWYPKDGFILSITPHMHVRGKTFELFADRGGQTETLLRVPAYDFNWQHDYDLETPLPLSDVDRLHFRAIFDNSDQNPFNPNPHEYVMWGDQTWEEMALVFLRVAEPRKADDFESAGETGEGQRAQQEALQWNLALQFAEQYIDRFDQNDDDLLSSHEVPKSVRAFRFHRYDLDDDGYLTRDEMANNALQRYLEATSIGRDDGRRKF